MGWVGGGWETYRLRRIRSSFSYRLSREVSIMTTHSPWAVDQMSWRLLILYGVCRWEVEVEYRERRNMGR